jgi:hypothetical protein
MKTTISQLDAIAAQATLIANAGTRLGTPKVSGFFITGGSIHWEADRPGNMNFLIQAANLIPPAPNAVALLNTETGFTEDVSGNTIVVTDTGALVLYYVVSDIHGNNSQSVINSFAFTH